MDNSKVHSTGLQNLEDAGHEILNFPPKSPDLNPIDHVWAELQKKVNSKLRKITISNREQLISIVNECWINFNPNFIPSSIM